MEIDEDGLNLELEGLQKRLVSLGDGLVLQIYARAEGRTLTPKDQHPNGLAIHGVLPGAMVKTSLAYVNEWLKHILRKHLVKHEAYADCKYQIGRYR